MQRLPLTINGVDFSAAVSRLEYSIVYEDRVGDNTMMMINGDEYPDVIDQRPVIVWPLNALWASELAALYTAIGTSQYVTVQYFDTKTGAAASGTFRATISSQRVGLVSSRGNMTTDMTLTLRAR